MTTDHCLDLKFGVNFKNWQFAGERVQLEQIEIAAIRRQDNKAATRDQSQSFTSLPVNVRS